MTGEPAACGEHADTDQSRSEQRPGAVPEYQLTEWAAWKAYRIR